MFVQYRMKCAASLEPDLTGNLTRVGFEQTEWVGANFDPGLLFRGKIIAMQGFRSSPFWDQLSGLTPNTC